MSNRSEKELSSGYLSSIDVREIDRVEMNRRMEGDGGRENVVIVRTDGKWHLDSPVKAEADEESVKRLIDAVVFAERGEGLSEFDMVGLGRTLRDFGLTIPRCIVTISAGKSQDTFSLGRSTAANDEVYVSSSDKKGVFTVSSKMAAELMRPLAEFRRRRLFTFSASDVMGLGLKDAGEPLIRITKMDGQWRIADPMDAPADRKTVEDLINALCSVQIADYVPDASSGHGLGDGEGFSVLLRDSFGAVEKVVLGTMDGTNMVWAMTPEGAVVHIDRDILDKCKNRQRTLEDTRLFPMEASFVTSISVSEGFPAYVISRQNASSPWTIVSPVSALADAKVVDALLSDILSLRGTEIVPDGSEEAVLVSLNTTSTNFPSQYVMASSVMREARFADILGKTIFRSCRERIKRIFVKPAAGEGWDASISGDVVSLVDSGIVAEQVATVVLRPEEFAKCGFNRPAYTISFELNDGATSLKRMLIGSVAPGGGRYAMIGGLDAAFVLPPSVISILTNPVNTQMENN
jgi:hypothetical protein